MTKEEVERRLWLGAQHRASQFGFSFAGDCRDIHFRPFLATGVARLEAEGFLDDPVRIALAEANIIAFTAQMIVAAKQMGLDRLHEPTFFEARAVICPLWPFC